MTMVILLIPTPVQLCACPLDVAMASFKTASCVKVQKKRAVTVVFHAAAMELLLVMRRVMTVTSSLRHVHMGRRAAESATQTAKRLMGLLPSVEIARSMAQRPVMMETQ